MQLSRFQVVGFYHPKLLEMLSFSSIKHRYAKNGNFPYFLRKRDGQLKFIFQHRDR